MKIVADKNVPFLEGVFEPYAEVVYMNGKEISREDLLDADAMVIRTRTKCNADLLEGTKVSMIATATIGFDHIDMEYCRTHNIAVTTAQGCNAAGVLQWVAAVLAQLSLRDGWQPQDITLGIVGVGHVGSLVEEYARKWGFKVVCCDPPRQEREGGDFLPLEEVVSQADIITFHTPLDSSTYHLIDDNIISLIRPDATIINASRGEVADTSALLKAPQTLLLDVWEREPNINSALLEKAIVATPHIAGYSAQGKANATAAVVAAAAQHFALPLEGWYPSQVRPTLRQPISWNEMCQSITQYCDLEAQSAELKSHPEAFESLRNNYSYREEYF
jgi:erythronate-4-phosphate dehydrogenase